MNQEDIIKEFRGKFQCKCGDPNCLTDKATVENIEQFLLAKIQEARSQLIKEIEILKDDKRKGDYGRGFDRAIDQVIKYLKK